MNTIDARLAPGVDVGVDRYSDYGPLVARVAGWALTATISIIFLWFGSMKFIDFEQQALVGLISNNPLISWLYTLFGVAGGAMFLGVFEIATGLLVAARVANPKLSALGGAMGAWSFLLTVSCMFTTPGVVQAGHEGTLALSGMPGGFLLKDIVLFSACLWILGTSLSEMRGRRR